MMQADDLFTPHLSTVSLKERIDAGFDTVLIALGSTEQHGPALPLLVDNAHGLETCLRAARRVGKTLVGPTVPFGFAPHHAAFPGSIHLRAATLEALIRDVAESCVRSGFRLVYFWVAHGESSMVLSPLLPKLRDAFSPSRVDGLNDLSAYLAATWGVMGPRHGVAAEIAGSHAGEIETSMMLAIDPRLVCMERATAGNPAPFNSIAEQMMREGMAAVSPSGVLGDQRAGDASRGDRYLDILAEWLAADVKRARNEAGLD